VATLGASAFIAWSLSSVMSTWIAFVIAIVFLGLLSYAWATTPSGAWSAVDRHVRAAQTRRRVPEASRGLAPRT
jgi:hypothetical protein